MIRSRDPRDRENVIAPEVMLKDGGVLHRIVNCDGEKVSAIWVKGVEKWSCYRLEEANMVKRWNEK